MFDLMPLTTDLVVVGWFSTVRSVVSPFGMDDRHSSRLGATSVCTSFCFDEL